MNLKPLTLSLSLAMSCFFATSAEAVCGFRRISSDYGLSTSIGPLRIGNRSEIERNPFSGDHVLVEKYELRTSLSADVTDESYFNISRGQQLIFYRSFRTRDEARNAPSLCVRDLPRNADDMRNLPIGSVVSLPATMTLSFGWSDGEVISDDGNLESRRSVSARIFVSGRFDIQVYRLNQDKVRMRITTVASKGRSIGARVSAKYYFLPIASLSVNAVEEDGLQLLGEYEFDLRQAQARRAFNQAIGSSLGFNDLKQMRAAIQQYGAQRIAASSGRFSQVETARGVKQTKSITNQFDRVSSRLRLRFLGDRHSSSQVSTTNYLIDHIHDERYHIFRSQYTASSDSSLLDRYGFDARTFVAVQPTHLDYPYMGVIRLRRKTNLGRPAQRTLINELSAIVDRQTRRQVSWTPQAMKDADVHYQAFVKPLAFRTIAERWEGTPRQFDTLYRQFLTELFNDNVRKESNYGKAVEILYSAIYDNLSGKQRVDLLSKFDDYDKDTIQNQSIGFVLYLAKRLNPSLHLKDLVHVKLERRQSDRLIATPFKLGLESEGIFRTLEEAQRDLGGEIYSFINNR